MACLAYLLYVYSLTIAIFVSVIDFAQSIVFLSPKTPQRTCLHIQMYYHYLQLCSSPLPVCHIRCTMWCSLGATCQKGLMPISCSLLWLVLKINTPVFSFESPSKKTTGSASYSDCTLQEETASCPSLELCRRSCGILSEPLSDIY